MKTPLEHWLEILDKQIDQLKAVCELDPPNQKTLINEDLTALPDADLFSSQPMIFDHLISHLKLGWTIVQSNTIPTENKALAKALKESRKVWWEKENRQIIFSCLAIDVIRSHRRLVPLFDEKVVEEGHLQIPTVDELREHFKMLASAIDRSMIKEKRLITDVSSFVSAVTKTVKSGHERIYGGLSVLLGHVESALKCSRPLARCKKVEANS
jgi:hypothetical protein